MRIQSTPDFYKPTVSKSIQPALPAFGIKNGLTTAAMFRTICVKLYKDLPPEEQTNINPRTFYRRAREQYATVYGNYLVHGVTPQVSTSTLKDARQISEQYQANVDKLIPAFESLIIKYQTPADNRSPFRKFCDARLLKAYNLVKRRNADKTKQPVIIRMTYKQFFDSTVRNYRNIMNPPAHESGLNISVTRQAINDFLRQYSDVPVQVTKNPAGKKNAKPGPLILS